LTFSGSQKFSKHWQMGNWVKRVLNYWKICKIIAVSKKDLSHFFLKGKNKNCSILENPIFKAHKEKKLLNNLNFCVIFF